MSNEEQIARLRTLRTSPNRTIASRLRELLPEIEATLDAGLTYADVVAALAESGIPVTLKTFNTTLARLRKEAAKKGARPPETHPQDKEPAASRTHRLPPAQTPGELKQRIEASRKAAASESVHPGFNPKFAAHKKDGQS